MFHYNIYENPKEAGYARFMNAERSKSKRTIDHIARSIRRVIRSTEQKIAEKKIKISEFLLKLQQIAKRIAIEVEQIINYKLGLGDEEKRLVRRVYHYGA